MTDKKTITGCTSYKDFSAQQHDVAFSVFESFLTKIRPNRILEIGTAGGGFTLFLRDTLDKIGLTDVPIKSFEVHEMTWYDTLREKNIEVNIVNIFNYAYNAVEATESVVPFIQEPGTTLILCDGGYKIGEFNAIAPYIKVGDYIMAHDYSSTLEYFNEHIYEKIWNWCEVQDFHIADVCNEYHLEKYKEDDFQKVVWTCRKKVK